MFFKQFINALYFYAATGLKKRHEKSTKCLSFNEMQWAMRQSSHQGLAVNKEIMKILFQYPHYGKQCKIFFSLALILGSINKISACPSLLIASLARAFNLWLPT